MTLQGSGFTAEDNDIGFRNPEIQFQGRNVGYLTGLSSPDGKTLRFSLPDPGGLLGACAFSQLQTNQACPDIGLRLPAGASDIFVVNKNGQSDSLTVTVAGLPGSTPEP